MHDKIKQAMALAFQVDALSIPDDAAINIFPAWDSLAHMQLMLELELEFGVSISSTDMLELLSMDDIKVYLEKRVSA